MPGPGHMMFIVRESKPDNRHATFDMHVGQRCTSSRVGVTFFGDVAEGAYRRACVVCRDVSVAAPEARLTLRRLSLNT